MHVLLIPSWYPQSPNDVNGVFFRDQALALKDQGVKVGVISISIQSLKAFTIRNKLLVIRKEDDEGIPTFRINTFNFLPKSESAWIISWRYYLKKFINEYISQFGRPDLFHVHSAIFAGIAIKSISEELKIPYVITEHRTGFGRKIFKARLLNKAKEAFLGASRCIAVSEDFKKQLIEIFPASNSKWEYIPNAVSSRFNNLTPRQSRANRNEFVLGTLSLLTEKKDHLTLLHAFKKLHQDFGFLKLLIGGEGELKGKLKEFVKCNQLENHVEFVGHINPEDTPLFYQKCDLFVLTSKIETFGVVLIEALACGVPVISTDSGGPSSIIINEKIGKIVPVNNPIELSEAVSDFIQCNHFDSHYLQSYVQGNFSSKAVANKILNTYLRVVNEKYPS